MGEPFKDRIQQPLLRVAADHLAVAWPAFPRRRFLALANEGLAELELKQRVLQVARAFDATLPAGFDRAATILEQTLAPARADTDLAALQPGDDGLAGWIVWPMTEFIAMRGLGEPQRALRALHAMTQRFSAEFAIRPFLVRHPEPTFATLRQWVADPSAHVRRLVSEGSRPRLPWGIRLAALVADPSPTLPLLLALQDDPSDYVRRSVANHLNDVAKDHPHLVAEWLERHLPDAPPQRRTLLRHASRTLIKRGDRRVLAAFGFDRPFRGEVAIALVPQLVRSGGCVDLVVSLRSTAKQPQRLVVDYVVHHVKRDGRTSPKVWKGWSLELPPAAERRLEKRHSLVPVTTRTDHPGHHRVELSINGRIVAASGFDLDRLAPRGRPPRQR